ncbi:hypothetical protein ONR57_01690 [Hoyosella sp. YIM 151337]|uniref:hypothetical protein n=1 Tax=Hoyosella sp. YIM 151337 TaxID=2992742 RepID=UPI00223574C7|nr:hypothetical protein [Hoyosella sp. YIM 151337]MCW4352009.1 hypothetical protein [Hoyosella sp. YIM 151337]
MNLTYKTKRLLITALAASMVAASLIGVRTGDPALAATVFAVVLLAGSVVAFLSGRR